MNTILSLTLEKIIEHLTENGGLKGSVYTVGSSAVGTATSLWHQHLLESLQILSWMLSIIVGILTIYGLIKKYIKEYKDSKKDTPL